MLQGRKKKKDLQNEESDMNDFFKSKTLLEYQNKCLCTVIDDLEAKVKEKTKYANSLEKRIESLAEVFMTISLEIYNINETATNVILQNKIPSNSDENLVAVQMLTNILKDIQNNSNICLNSMTIHDQLKSLVDNISSNVVNLINSVIHIITYEKEVKSNIERGLYERLQENVMTEYDNLKSKNEELQKKYMTLYESNKNVLKDYQLLRANYTLLEESTEAKDRKIEELDRAKFNLLRKMNTHPSLPYIKFEKKMFNTMADNHQCVCHICGSDGMSNVESKLNEDVNMTNAEKENELIEKNNQTMNDLVIENENLKERLRQLHEEFQRFKLESVITEDKLVNSKPFKVLLSQAEQLMLLIDSLKDANLELTRQKSDLLKEKEMELKNVEAKFNEKIFELGKVMLSQATTMESNKLTINDCNVKMATLENVLKTKENKDINSIFDNYQQEKENFLRQMESLRKQLKDYERKYDEEFKRNKLLEDRMENIETRVNVDGKDVNAIIDKRLLKKADQIKKLEAELKSEREYKEIFISELEVNEKGLNEINKKLKSMTNQLLDCNEKIAKMTNEKMKDMETIKRLDEEKDTIEKRMKGLEEQVKLETDLRTRLNADHNISKEIIYKLEQDLKIKEEDAEIMKHELIKIKQLVEQYKISYENTLTALKEMENVSSKHASNYEQMKINYKELCKIKNLDSSQIGKSISEMKKEIDGLTAEASKYKDMVKCNVCRERPKDTINTKCFHMLCKECIDDTCRNRNRICPICKTKIISNSDFHPIFWD